ncbi:MAG: hypothetical protein AAGF95_34680, partial [Chloroflexota bacterium]
VVDLQTARRMVQDAEKYREHSVYWESGYHWETAFAELIYCEQTELQTLLQVADTIDSSEGYVIQYHHHLRPHLKIKEGIQWYKDFCESLSRKLTKWEIDETISVEAYGCMEKHTQYLTDRISLLDIMLQWVELQQLERQRHRDGYVDTRTWTDIWHTFEIRLLDYRMQAERRYGVEEYDHVTVQFVGWLEKILIMQTETLRLHNGQNNGNSNQLQGHMRIVEKTMKKLRSKSNFLNSIFR